MNTYKPIGMSQMWTSTVDIETYTKTLEKEIQEQEAHTLKLLDQLYTVEGEQKYMNEQSALIAKNQEKVKEALEKKDKN